MDNKTEKKGLASEKETHQDSTSCHLSEIIRLLNAASETYQNDDGWVNAADAGNYIKRVRPDFGLKAFSFSKLSDLICQHSELYETKKESNGKYSVFF